MQLKRYPEDFRVRELVDLPERMDRGDYFVHKLRKEKLDTHEAIAIVARELDVDRAEIAFAGLKDRQGITEQFISIKGKSGEFRRRGVQLNRVGRTEAPITSKISRGNEFRIVVRALDDRDIARVERRTDEIRESGFPNYFDDQRFNCLRHGQGFVMKEVLAGRFDQALRQLIATPSPRAISGDVKLKRLFAENWLDWERCSRIGRGPVYRRVFQHLLHRPNDFRGALEQLPTRNKLIHAFAYQSHLWNRSVSRYVEDMLHPKRKIAIEIEAGRCVGWWDLPPAVRDRLREDSTPLYAPDGDGGTPPFRRAVERTLREAKLTPAAFDLHRVRGMELRSEERACLVMPRKLEIVEIDRDEANRGARKAELKFELPRGSYATMMLKCVFARPWVRNRDRKHQPKRREHS